MKKFEEFVTETVIKLRGSSSQSAAQLDKFMDDLHATTEEHPFNPRMRIVNGNVGVHVSKGDRGIHIHDILSFAPKSGAGTMALRHLKSLADKHNVALEGTAKGYTNEGNRIGSSTRLRDWYTKHGFTAKDGDEHEGYDIHYAPKRLH